MLRLALFISLLSVTPAMCQDMNSIWIFGDSAGIDFSNVNNPVPISSAIDSRGSCVSISDSSGNLILYSFTQALGITDWSTRILNSSDTDIAGADSITGEGWYNELTIVPNPLSQNQFYVFSVGLDIPNDGGLYYTLVDMNLNGGSGGLIRENVQVKDSGMADCIAAIKHGNGRDWWVISKLTNHNVSTYMNRFYVVLVTPDSVHAPIVQELGGARDADFQKMIFKASGDTFMLVNRAGFMGEYLFNRCDGSISQLRIILTPPSYYLWEGAYSPSGSVFYVSTIATFLTDPNHLIQFDLTASDIPLSADTLRITYPPEGGGAPRLAPDGKIYWANGYISPGSYSYPYEDTMRNFINENLSVINSPDILGTGCDFQPYSFYLGGKRTYGGLPNNPNYSLGRLIGSACDTLYVSATAVERKSEIRIFPNPTPGPCTIQHEGFTISRLSVYGLLGNEVYNSQNPHSPPSTHLDLSFLPEGIYVVSFETGSGPFSLKVVKM